MAAITGKYEGNLRNELTYCDSGSKIITDASSEVDGKSKDFTPTDIVCGAIASCMLTIMGLMAQKHGFSIDGATYEVNGTMVNEPRRVGQIDVIINFPSTYTEKQQAMLWRAADSCPVKNTLRDDTIINITMNFLN